MSDKSKKFEQANDLELMQLFTDLVNLSGQKFVSEEDANITYTSFIPLFRSSFGRYSVDEIRLAYQYAREGRFTKESGEQFRLYRELNYSSACDVMLEYEEYKKKEIGEFVQNQKLFEQPTQETPEEQKKRIERDGLRQFLRESWELCENSKLNETTGILLYDSLKQRGLIDLSKEEKIDIQETAKRLVQEQAEYERKESLDTTMCRYWDKLIKTLSGETNEVVLMSKKIALQYQIQNWIMEGNTVEQIEQLIV
jgi:hypothetical protein